MSTEQKTEIATNNLKQKYENFSLRQILDEKDKLKKKAVSLMPKLNLSLEKKSERLKGYKTIDDIKEIYETLVILDQLQDQRDE